MGMDMLILWFSLCEAVERLQAEGQKFEVNPDELANKWKADEAQDRVTFDETDEGIVINIEEEIN